MLARADVLQWLNFLPWSTQLLILFREDEGWRWRRRRRREGGRLLEFFQNLEPFLKTISANPKCGGPFIAKRSPTPHTSFGQRIWLIKFPKNFGESAAKRWTNSLFNLMPRIPKNQGVIAPQTSAARHPAWCVMQSLQIRDLIPIFLGRFEAPYFSGK